MEIYSIRITETSVSLDETMLDNDNLYRVDFAPTAIVKCIVENTDGVIAANCTVDPLTFSYSLNQEGREEPKEVAIRIAYRIARCFQEEVLICASIDFQNENLAIIPDTRELIEL